jgi:hypothetical protein
VTPERKQIACSYCGKVDEILIVERSGVLWDTPSVAPIYVITPEAWYIGLDIKSGYERGDEKIVLSDDKFCSWRCFDSRMKQREEKLKEEREARGVRRFGTLNKPRLRWGRR